MALNNNRIFRANLMDQTALGIRFVTNGTGEPELEFDYGGDVTIEKLANAYTITLNTMSDITQLLALPYSYSKRKDVNCVMTPRLPEKKFDFLFDAPLSNTRFDALIVYLS